MNSAVRKRAIAQISAIPTAVRTSAQRTGSAEMSVVMKSVRANVILNQPQPLLALPQH